MIFGGTAKNPNQAIEHRARAGCYDGNGWNRGRRVDRTGLGDRVRAGGVRGEDLGCGAGGDGGGTGVHCRAIAGIAGGGAVARCARGVVHVQENGPERVPEKTALFAEMDRLAAPDVVLASSTSGIPARAFTEALAGRGRTLVAHPVNPPYLIPVVELCPAPWTDPAIVTRTRGLMERAGQVPATVNREVAGFVLNRLQIALVSEAMRLVADGVISAEDVDATVKHGLGLRWSFMGPLETIDLNAPGGLADYLGRYGGLYTEVQEETRPLALTAELIAGLHGARRAVLPMEAQAARQEWRDRRLMGLLAHKAGQAEG